MNLADNKNDNEYNWLQEQLTNDVNMLNDSPLKQKNRSNHHQNEISRSKFQELEDKNQSFKREMSEIQQLLATEVNSQVTQNMTVSTTNSSNNQANKDFTEDEDLSYMSKRKDEKPGKKMPILVALLIVCVLIGGAVGIIMFGKQWGKKALVSVGFMDNGLSAPEEVVVSATPTIEITQIPTLTPEPTVTPEAEKVIDEVYNVLLIGIDDMDQAADAIMVVSINVTDQTYHVIQFMRDLYVNIPDYRQECISEAYRYGGGNLLMQTITDNFNLPIEGYLSVGFDDFREIIDSMGGVTIKLTKAEADYLNTTNYIKEKSNRVMVKGEQKMNGDQALGYCRIQAVPNAEDLESDFGRVTRAKAVLSQLVQTMKDMSFGDLISQMNYSLPHIHTNLTKDKFKQLIEITTTIGIKKFDSLRVPVYTLYKRDRINGSTVYLPDFEKTNSKIQTLIYGEEEKKE